MLTGSGDDGRCLAGVAPIIDDGNPCTDDSCVEAQGVTHVSVADGAACATAEIASGVCVNAGCLTSRCGDGYVIAPEQCDDFANANSCDGCSDTCQRLENYRCGDGFVCGGESCDAGAANNAGACSGCCRTDCTGQRCGDAIVDIAERCDDGEYDGWDGCVACEGAERALLETLLDVRYDCFIASSTIADAGGASFVVSCTYDSPDDDTDQHDEIDCTPIGCGAYFSVPSSPPRITPTSGSDASGGMVIVSTVGTSPNEDVQVERFASNGASLGAPAIATADAAGSQVEPVIAVASDGSFVVGWRGECVNTASRRCPFVRRFDVNGAPTSGDIPASVQTFESPFSDVIPSTIRRLNDGSIVLVWFARSPRSPYSSSGVVYRSVIASDGTLTP